MPPSRQAGSAACGMPMPSQALQARSPSVQFRYRSRYCVTRRRPLEEAPPVPQHEETSSTACSTACHAHPSTTNDTSLTVKEIRVGDNGPLLSAPHRPDDPRHRTCISLTTLMALYDQGPSERRLPSWSTQTATTSRNTCPLPKATSAPGKAVACSPRCRPPTMAQHAGCDAPSAKVVKADNPVSSVLRRTPRTRDVSPNSGTASAWAAWPHGPAPMAGSM